MSKRIEVRLTGNHPHDGCMGYVEVDDEGKAETVARGMFLVTMTNCCHGTDACYAERKDMLRVTTEPIREPQKAQDDGGWERYGFKRIR